MKRTFIKIFWGVILISLGGLSLADKLGYVNLTSITNQTWAVIFATLSAAFFLSYFLSGVRQWGWLFPALIFAALALTIGTILGNPDNPIIAMPILLSVGIPFYVGYLVDRRHWGLLIPAWILTVISVIPILSERVDSNLIGSLILYAIAVPFLIIYLVNHRYKWAIITASIMAIIGTLPILDLFLDGEYSGSIAMFLFALPFLVTYFVAKKNWWALIPAGIFTSIGLVVVLSNLFPDIAYYSIGNIQIGIFTSVLFLGFAITFGILWLLRGSRPTEWAKYPAIGLLIVALVSFLIGKSFEDLLPAVLLLVIGSVMVIAALAKRKVTDPTNT